MPGLKTTGSNLNSCGSSSDKHNLGGASGTAHKSELLPNSSSNILPAMSLCPRPTQITSMYPCMSRLRRKARRANRHRHDVASSCTAYIMSSSTRSTHQPQGVYGDRQLTWSCYYYCVPNPFGGGADMCCGGRYPVSNKRAKSRGTAVPVFQTYFVQGWPLAVSKQPSQCPGTRLHLTRGVAAPSKYTTRKRKSTVPAQLPQDLEQA